MAKVITMRGLGSLNQSDYSLIPNGFEVCTPPKAAKPYGAWEEVKDGWVTRMLINPGDPLNYWEYYNDYTGESFSICQSQPKTGMEDESASWYAKEQRLRVAELQTQLNAKARNHPNYPLKVDGDLGPKTCEAAYRYQQIVLGIRDRELTSKFWTMLDLPSEYKQTLGMGCGSWYSTYIEGEKSNKPEPQPKPQPEPEPDLIPKATVVEKSNRVKRLMAALVGLGSGALIGVAVKKQRRSSLKTWEVAAAGGTLGLVGGFVFGLVNIPDETKQVMAGIHNRRTNHPAYGPMSVRGTLEYVPAVVKSQPRSVGALGQTIGPNNKVFW